MANYLLDANHISPLVTVGHPLRQKISQRLQAGDVFGIPTPALTEALFGFRVLPRANKNVAEWKKLSTRFDYYGVDRQDAEQAAELQVTLRRRGWQLHTVDALIAAIALRYDLTILTTDKDFRAVPGLRWENWL